MNNLKSKDGRKRHLETGQQHRYLDSHYYNINITLDWVKKIIFGWPKDVENSIRTEACLLVLCGGQQKGPKMLFSPSAFLFRISTSGHRRPWLTCPPQNETSWRAASPECSLCLRDPRVALTTSHRNSFPGECVGSRGSDQNLDNGATARDGSCNLLHWDDP